jgi:hypothetical protein
MEVEERLLTAIDQLAKDGSAGEIRCLAALLACRGKVEQRSLGWQHPFRDYAEQEGAACRQQLNGLIKRGILVESRSAVSLNSQIMTYNKSYVTGRCANRLFTRAFSTFAPVLRQMPFDDLRELSRLQSVPAENRFIRKHGALYRQLRQAGLLVSSSRTRPYVFPSLCWVDHVPEALVVALTLEQGGALTWENCLHNSGIIAHMAVATGFLEHEAQQDDVRLSPKGRELGAAYLEKAIRRRLNWIPQCREETMQLLLDELAAPLPAVWIDGAPSRVDKTWFLQPDAPYRIFLKDRQLRIWLRRLVRHLVRMGAARLIDRGGQGGWYYFAPGAAQMAKAALELPAERFTLPPEFEAQCRACNLLLRISRESDSLWRIRLDTTAAMGEAIAEQVSLTLRKLKAQRMISGPADDGTYRILDPDVYRWTLVEWLLDPITEFLGSLPEAEQIIPDADSPLSRI